MNVMEAIVESSQGLSSDEAEQRFQRYGPNRLPEAASAGIPVIFLRQFLSPFIYILFIAAAASLLLNQIPNAIFINAVLILNAVIGTFQEYSAQKSAAALRNLVKGSCQVLRDGQVKKMDVEQLVPGDVVLLVSGDKVPADINLLEAVDLTIDESMLTGESLATEKLAGGDTSEDSPLAERDGQCFGGTIVNRGRGKGLVLNTGLDTQLGKIAHQVTEGRESEPPLMIRIRHFTYQTAAAIAVGICLLVGIMLVRGGYDVEGMAMMAIGLAVSTIPEGLPAALTVALSIGMRRMAQNNVIIRKLVAVEALGSCTFICSDKTGTLTVNELTIRQLLLPNGEVFQVSGEGVSPGGDICPSSGQQAAIELCMTGVLANESHLQYGGENWSSDGDIVDVAFLVLAKKMGLSLSQLQSEQQQLALIPYESENAFSGSVNHDASGMALHVKGSPEKMMAMCSHMLIDGQMVAIDRPTIEAQFNGLASQGYRIIALAKRTVPDASTTDHLQDMVFLGMVAMIDPVRPEAKAAIERCRRGGIEVAMVTGDHPATAKAIAVDLGLSGLNDAVVTGTDIREANKRDGHVDGVAIIAKSASTKAADELIRSVRVFARIEPQQKQQIVDSLMREGHFVAVTGDGVNDAPAMRQSHVGVAMGKRGTDVAKETAQLIITDDNFASIVAGIEQGRIVYNNIRKVIGLLIATGFSALLLFFLSVAAGLPMPMNPIQLLWLNLVANGFQDVALAFEPGEGNELDKPARKPSEPIFDKHIIEHVLVAGSVMGGLAFVVFYVLNAMELSLTSSQNFVLLLMVLFGNMHALSSRSETRSLFTMSLNNRFLLIAVPVAQLVHIACMYIPGISDVMGLEPVSFIEWAMLAAVALVFLSCEELHKYLLRQRQL